MANINLLAVIASIVVAMVLGTVWYHPKVFGTKWMSLIGRDPKQMKPNPMMYVVVIIFALLTVLTMAHFITATDAQSLGDGLKVGLWAWVGFTGATMGVNFLFEGRSWKLYALTAGYHLVNFMLISGILVLWK
jgi:hypothetical protein